MSDQNIENVNKLTKYQIRLTGGSKEHADVYRYKINEYSRKLENNGINSKKIIDTIQTGGNPLDELRNQLATKTNNKLSKSNSDLSDVIDLSNTLKTEMVRTLGDMVKISSNGTDSYVSYLKNSMDSNELKSIINKEVDENYRDELLKKL